MVVFADCLKVAGFTLTDWSLLATIFGAIVAAIGVGVAAVGVFMVWFQIKISNSIRTAELIAKIYDAFAEDELGDFYARIRKPQQIDWEHNPKDKGLLDKSLTLCDEVCYLHTQGLLHRKATAWEYVASEIQYFAHNESVWGYMAERRREGREEGLPDNSIPYTGFPELFRKLPRKYRAKHYQEIYAKHKDFFSPSVWARISARLRHIVRGTKEKGR